MNIAEPFIKRPVMTSLVMFAIMLFGVLGYRALPVSDLPNVDFPTITVGAGLPGASPETMASAVAMPLERQFSTIAGVDSMTSTSSLGSTSITLQFNLDRDIDAAAQDVQAMIAKANRDLPPDMPSPPSYQKVNPADAPILYLAFTSPTMNLSDLNEYAETTVAQRISMVSGVAQVAVYGSQKYAVRVQREPAGWNALRQPAGVPARNQWAIDASERLRAANRCLSQRIASSAWRTRAGDRQRRERQVRKLVQWDAGYGARGPTTARY
jgi:HAE1 family hydrophobic/amphiphilic exporter-1